MAKTPSPRGIGASAMRARFMLEAAAGMGADADEPFGESEIRLARADGDGHVRISSSSVIDGIARVVACEIDFAFINPSAALTLAWRGTGSYFKAPQPVRAVTVLPSRDQCLFAVHASTGLASIEDIGRAKYPLKLGLRGKAQHWLHNMLDDIFAAAGFSLDDLVSWGGSVHKTGHIPRPGAEKFDALVRGELTAIFDEGVHGWADAVVTAGLTPLCFGEETLARLEEIGYRRDVLPKRRFPSLPADVPTLDFSGWPVLTHAETDDSTVRQFCAALEARRNAIPWEGSGPLPLDRMCRDVPEAPLGVPLHPAAAAYWTSLGYL